MISSSYSHKCPSLDFFRIHGSKFPFGPLIEPTRSTISGSITFKAYSLAFPKEICDLFRPSPVKQIITNIQKSV